MDRLIFPQQVQLPRGINPERLFTVGGEIEGVTQQRALLTFLANLLNCNMLDQSIICVNPLNRHPLNLNYLFGNPPISSDDQSPTPSPITKVILTNFLNSIIQEFNPLELYGYVKRCKPLMYSLTAGNTYPTDEMVTNQIYGRTTRKNQLAANLVVGKLPSTGSNQEDGKHVYQTLQSIIPDARHNLIYFSIKTGVTYLFFENPSLLLPQVPNHIIVGYRFVPIIEAYGEKSRDNHGMILPIFQPDTQK